MYTYCKLCRVPNIIKLLVMPDRIYSIYSKLSLPYINYIIYYKILPRFRLFCILKGFSCTRYKTALRKKNKTQILVQFKGNFK